MKKVVVSAPGKYHLAGEHTVVHGKPAVLVATSARLYVTLEDQKAKGKSKNSIAQVKHEKSYLAEIIRLFEKKYQVELDSNLSISINSDIPVKAGMGSSAALSVAIIGALTQWQGKPWSPQEINEMAYETEKLQHGNPSGGDNTVATYGGILWYRKELEFLKTFWLLPYKIPKSFSPVVLMNTGRVETTGELVTQVSRLRKKDEVEFILLVSSIEDVTRNMVQAIHDANESLFRKMIQDNERLLEIMGVVSTSTKKLIREIEHAGGSAKISGAGGVKRGSGIVIATHDEPKVIFTIAMKYNFPSFQAVLGGEGVRIEQVTV